MDYKSIIVHAQANPEAQGRMRCAADLADRFGGVLIGCGSEAEAVADGDPFSVAPGELMALQAEQVEQNITAAHTAFEAIAKGRDYRWISEHMTPTDALALHSRAADLIVTGAPTGDRFDPRRDDDLGLLVIIAGRPVLVTPPQRDYLAADRILVCWMDSREARRAVSDAMPLLTRAKEVLVASVAGPNGLAEACETADEVAEALRRHGVSANGEGLLRDERRVGAILCDRAAAMGADLIVAGGYGRTRLGEWVFGGVTQSLIRQTDRFVLLSH